MKHTRHPITAALLLALSTAVLLLPTAALANAAAIAAAMASTGGLNDAVASRMAVKQAQSACQSSAPLTGSAEALKRLCKSATEHAQETLGGVIATEFTASNQINALGSAEVAKTAVADDQQKYALASDNLNQTGSGINNQRAAVKKQTRNFFIENAQALGTLIEQSHQEAQEKEQEASQAEMNRDNATANRLRREANAMNDFAKAVEEQVKSLFEQEAAKYHLASENNKATAGLMDGNTQAALQGATALAKNMGGDSGKGGSTVSGDDAAKRYATNSAADLNNTSSSASDPGLWNWGNKSGTPADGNPLGNNMSTPTDSLAAHGSESGPSVKALLDANAQAKDTALNTSSMGGGLSAPGSAAGTTKADKKTAATAAVTNTGTMDGGGGIVSNPISSDLGLSIAMNEGLDFSGLMNNMLGEAPESEASDLTADRELASIANDGDTAEHLPQGVLHENSETLFKRVKSANVRQLERGLLLNGLNSKI